MMYKGILGFMAAFLLATAGLAAPLTAAENRECRKLAAPVSGEARKYSVKADIYEFMAFPDIPCAVYWRNNELCATELSAFQFSAKVFDFVGGGEILMTEAYFVVAAPGEPLPLAFADREEAAGFIARSGGGELLDYGQLLDHSFD